MRILLTDIMFPNKYAKWRLVEIHSFMEKYDTDILVIDRINEYKNIKFDFDYDCLKEKFNFEKYDILIFNNKYNYINKFNINFDGTKYNGLNNNLSYLIRKKIFSQEIFSLEKYDIIYHIFLMNYYKFNNLFVFPQNKQYIHLYLGGGVINANSMNNIHNDANIISSQYLTTLYLEKCNKKNIVKNMYGGSFFYKNEVIRKKNRDNKSITICFTSLGDLYEKGADKYIEIVDLYLQKYKNDNIKFISIGNCFDNKNIIKYEPIEQDKLSDFYYNNVDIIINLDSGKALNGFPLGIEAIIEGCLLLTTDIHGLNEKNNFFFDEFIIINNKNIFDIVEKIKYLYENINILNIKSDNLQEKIYDLFNYDNFMKKIFNFVEK